uniref:HNH endonuclease n=1 Tax=Pithovirus LCPAC304 TaxID=2506594 RepID=A0A481Z9Q8_9VIRU|nr:MAG: hypothetical protein LCPAC304_01570 [Pithovirus LCPAC304]
MYKICNGSLCDNKKVAIENFSPNRYVCKKCAACDRRHIYYPRLQRFKNKIKEGQVCKNCGESDIRLFDFAHFNRKDKEIGIARSFNATKIKKEIKKGRFLCIWCHRLETHQETLILSNMIRNQNPYTKQMQLDKLAKKCHGPYCGGTIRPSSCFYRRKSGNLRGECKKCLGLKSKKSSEWKKEYVISVKLAIAKCEVCENAVTQSTHYCFDFDHIDRTTKTESVSRMLNRRRPLSIIQAEIDKCRLLCCKCHRLHTWDQLGHRTYLQGNGEHKTNKCLDCSTTIQRNNLRCRDCKTTFLDKFKLKCSNKAYKNTRFSKPKKENRCVDCSSSISRQAKRCRSCYRKNSRKS